MMRRRFLPTPRAQDSYERSNRKTVERAARGEAQMTLTRFVKAGLSISSAEDSLASPSQSRGDEEVQKTRGGSGPSLPVLFAVYIPDTSSLKTCLGFSLPEDGNKEFAAYAAGLLDGEGCLTISTRSEGFGHGVYPKVHINMTTKGLPALQAMAQAYGGTVRLSRQPQGQCDAQYCWQVSGHRAVTMLAEVYPFMKVKTIQAACLLHLGRIALELPKRENGQTKWTERAMQDAQRLRWAILALNQTGPFLAPNVVGKFLLLPQKPPSRGQRWPRLRLIWPRWGTIVNGRVYQQPRSEPRTSVTGSLLLPTVRANKWGLPDSHGSTQAWMRLTPQEAVRSRMCSTPQAHDWKSGTGYSHDSNPHSPQPRHLSGGQLNPTWVEWLMGFPLGWTALEPSATPSSRKWRNGLVSVSSKRRRKPKHENR
jgi:hypothetical protein